MCEGVCGGVCGGVCLWRGVWRGGVPNGSYVVDPQWLLRGVPNGSYVVSPDGSYVVSPMAPMAPLWDTLYRGRGKVPHKGFWDST